MMRLLDNVASPYCRKVKVVLHETGQAGAVEIVPTGGHPTDPNRGALPHNPIGKIPVLLRPDGPALYDSRVICRYLSDRAGADLYPASRLWETLTLEATADGILDAAVLMIYETRSRPEDKRDPDWLEGQWAKIAAALNVLESRWMGHLAGPLDIGQIAVGCALGYLDFRHADRSWRDTRPALANWFESFGGSQAMQATVPANP